jgi:phosphatidylglycerol---prolipoprotein diacylglyceryl transferase
VGPLIPFIHAPELPLPFLAHIPLIDRLVDPAHPPSLKPFGTLVALGVYLGSVLAMRHARQRGIDEKRMNDFIFWTVAIGFVGGHMLDAVFYHPATLRKDPLYLFKLWDGLSSYGGFIGGVAGAFLWRLSRKRPILEYTDLIASAFPLAWVFGRAGCASVHDHPGLLSDAWFAVRWEMPDGKVVGRYDLGLYECLLTIPLAIAFAVLWRRDPYRPAGFYVGAMCVAYAPVRFLLDFLREQEVGGSAFGGDPRYGGLTPAQWACFGLLGLGLYILHRASKGAPTGPPAEEPAPDSSDESDAAENEP